MHLVFNNAGVGGRSAGLEELTAPDWEWVIRVNLMTVAHGVAIFLPHLRAHGEGGHFVNTASMAGMLGQPQMGPYSATKAAVVALSETLVPRVEGDECRRQRAMSRLRQDRHRRRAAQPARARGAAGVQGRGRAGGAGPARRPAGLDPAEVAARTLRGIRDEDLYIFTHPDMRPWLDKRLERIRAAYDKAERFGGSAANGLVPAQNEPAAEHARARVGEA